MKGQSVVHSKGKDDWRTPLWLFEYFNKKYKFGLDAAASNENTLCSSWFTEENDALKLSWKGYGNVFVNPPYSLNQKFIEKIINELDGNFSVVALVPSRTCTRWWHDYVMSCAQQIWFIKGRLTFSNADNCAPFPSSIIIFNDPPELSPMWRDNPFIYSLEKPKNVRLKPACDRSNSDSQNV